MKCAPRAGLGGNSPSRSTTTVGLPHVPAAAAVGDSWLVPCHLDEARSAGRAHPRVPPVRKTRVGGGVTGHEAVEISRSFAVPRLQQWPVALASLRQAPGGPLCSAPADPSPSYCRNSVPRLALLPLPIGGFCRESAAARSRQCEVAPRGCSRLLFSRQAPAASLGRVRARARALVDVGVGSSSAARAHRLPCPPRATLGLSTPQSPRAHAAPSQGAVPDPAAGRSWGWAAEQRAARARSASVSVCDLSIPLPPPTFQSPPPQLRPCCCPARDRKKSGGARLRQS